MSDVGTLFRQVHDCALAHGLAGGFPTFHEANYGNGDLCGSFMVRPGKAVYDGNVPALAVGHPGDVPARFRATHDYARTRGFVSGFPNFHQADYGNGLVYGTMLIPTASATYDPAVSATTLGSPSSQDVGAMFRAVHQYALRRGFASGFPNFHQADYGNGLVYGIVLLDADAIELRHVFFEVDFTFDSTHVDAISARGGSADFLTGGGIYLIGSRSGADIPETNFMSVGSTSGQMTNGGPPFTLTFARKSPDTLRFSANVGPVVWNVATLSMPFDFDRQYIRRFMFDGTQYHLHCTGADGPRTSSEASYDSIPRGCEIRDASGTLLGTVGVAIVDGSINWGSTSGPAGTVRVNIHGFRHYRGLHFHNHFGTNNLEPSFGALQIGESAFLEGEIVVTPRNEQIS